MGRREHLEEQLQKDYELLKNLEDRLRTETDPKLELRLNEDINKLKQQIRQREEELGSLSDSSVPNQNASDSRNSDREKGNSPVNMTFNAPVYGVAGNIQGNQNIYTSEQKQPLAGEEIQDVHKQQKILILSAIPHGLRLDKEIREIEEAIRRATRRDLFEIRVRTAVRPQDIRRAIAEEKPQIVHFCGHGLENGYLLLEDEGGNDKPVAPEALAGLFELFADQVECVVLNACYSEIQAQAIAQHINYVIGMSQAIGDRAAIEFAVGFYNALGAGRPVDFAYRLGCRVIRMAGIPENLTPQLLTRNHTAPVESKPPSVELYPSRTVTPYPSPPEPEQEVKPPTQLPPSQPTASPLAEPESEELESEELESEELESEELEEPITKPDEVKLCSEIGIDYNKLRDLLAAGKWNEADQETGRVMLQAAGRESERWLRVEDIDNFPCEDLRAINQLWLQYSIGKFGFSVQKKIYDSLGGTREYDEEVWTKFCDYIGWRKEENWLDYSNLTFDLWESSPKGHLPASWWFRSDPIRSDPKIDPPGVVKFLAGVVGFSSRLVWFFKSGWVFGVIGGLVVWTSMGWWGSRVVFSFLVWWWFVFCLWFLVSLLGGGWVFVGLLEGAGSLLDWAGDYVEGWEREMSREMSVRKKRSWGRVGVSLLSRKDL